MSYFFYFDFDKNSGFGHMVRSVRLALALSKFGSNVFVGLEKLNSVYYLALIKRGLDDSQIVTVEKKPSGNALREVNYSLWVERNLVATAVSLGADTVIIDSYHIRQSWLDVLHARGLRTVVIVDEPSNLTPHVLIDYGSDATAEKHKLTNGHSQGLLGPLFTPIEPRNSELITEPKAGTVLIALGGGGYAEIYERLLSSFDFLSPSLNITFAVTDYYSQNYVRLRKRATLVDASQGLLSHMYNHETVVTGAGLAMLERLAIGRRGVAVVTASNQEPNLNKLSENKSLKVVSAEKLAEPDAIVASTIEVIQSPWTTDESLPWQALFDGHGCSRIAIELGGVSELLTHIREATKSDIPILWRWHNHPSSRAVSHVQTTISPRDHINWFGASNARKERIFIGCCDTIPLGVVRVQNLASGSRISYSVDELYRRRGVAKGMISRVISDPIVARPIYAEVRHGNLQSERVLISLGFTLSSSNEAFCEYVLV